MREDLPVEQWEEACRREEVLRPLLTRIGFAGKVGRGEASAAAKALGLSAATVYRMLARYRKEKRVSALLSGSVGRPKGYRQIDATLDELIRQEIRQFYLRPERPTMKDLVLHVHARCHQQGLPCPAARTIKRRVEQVEPKRRARLRGEVDAVEAMLPTPGRLDVSRPLEMVQMDHTQVDLVVVDELTRQPIGRPWLTLGIDVFSRMTTGFSLSFNAPSATSVSLCLLNSVFEKSTWLQELGISVQWPIVGLPERIGVDNAAEFRSEQFAHACRDFGIAVDYRPRGGKHYGGHIERLIGTRMGAVHTLPGTTQNGIVSRQDYDSQAAAVLTLRELETWIALDIAGRYHQQIHSALLRPPIAIWREWEERLHLRLPHDRMAFWVSFLPGETRSLQRDGIHLFNITYWSDALRGDVGRVRERMEVRYDPRNISRVFVRRPNGHWVEARYRNLKRPAISLWEQNAALRLLRQKGRTEVSEDVLFETVLRQRELVAKAVTTSAVARLAKARTPMAPVPTQKASPSLTAIDLSRKN